MEMCRTSKPYNFRNLLCNLACQLGSMYYFFYSKASGKAEFRELRSIEVIPVELRSPDINSLDPGFICMRKKILDWQTKGQRHDKKKKRRKELRSLCFSVLSDATRTL